MCALSVFNRGGLDLSLFVPKPPRTSSPRSKLPRHFVRVPKVRWPSSRLTLADCAFIELFASIYLLPSCCRSLDLRMAQLLAVSVRVPHPPVGLQVIVDLALAVRVAWLFN